MTPERWKQINRVFQSALELEPEKRDEYLADACGEDESLRGQVETLLAADREAGRFISGHALKDGIHLIEETEAPDVLGKKIGQYELLSILGRGGMGKVYLARDPKLNRSIALKTLPKLLNSSSDYVRRFETEAKAAANLNHPNVATVHSVEEADDGRVFITMEYVEGKPLDEKIPDGGLDLRTFLEWFIPISDALAHAHERGIVHRDIKPGNIMITEAGVPKILDFGLARVERSQFTDEASTLNLTKTGQVMGTPAYMSPEQAEGSQADRRSDVFSLGVVMYEAITGEKPFKGENYASIVSKVLTHEPREVDDIRSDVPYLLSRLIMKCLNKEQRRRYQSMNEVRVILKEIESALVSGASLSRRGVGRRLGRRFGNGAAVLSAISGLLLISTIVFGWLWWSSSRTSETTPSRFTLAPPIDQELRLFEANLSRDGKMIVFASRSKGVRTLFVRSLERFEHTPVPGTDDAKEPFFSPDGTSIGFFLEDGSIKRVPVGGGDARTICSACKEASEGVWADDGFIYAYDPQGIFRIPDGGGSPERLTTLDTGAGDKSHRSPTLLPDGRVLFSKVGKDSVKFAVFDLSSKKVTIIEKVEGDTSVHGGVSIARYVAPGRLVYSSAGQLFAVRFDPASLETEGAPLPVLGGIFALPNFHIAENGTLVYLPEVSMDENQMIWVSRTGERQTVVDRRGNFRSPRIAPDGRRIAVQLDGDVWIFETDSGRSLRLTFDGNSQSPVWAPDGASVVFATVDDNVWKMVRAAADGSDSREELYSGESKMVPYSFHPSEPLIALASMPGPDRAEIALLSLNDRSIKPVIATQFKEDSPRFSPDGDSLAYFSMESGKVQVYISGWREGSESGKQVVSTTGGMFPVWGGGGREIFFRSGKRLLAAEIGPGSQIRQPVVLFEGDYLTGFDAVPDGSRFLMVSNEGGSMPSRMNIVLNWTSELDKLVPAGR
ncbi:MAG: protein kinase [Aridibacter famidurans]|nr:protein kinase [Aridibacter famidurans]